MEERMCQKQITNSKPTQAKSSLSSQSHQHVVNCHRCKMCSSFSSTSSSSSSVSSSSSLTQPTRDRYHKRQLPKQSSPDSKSTGCFIQQHLQSMFGILRREETLKMAVRLESAHKGRTRYLVVVSRIGRNLSEECCLLGIDCNKRTTVGLVLKVLADTAITLDGDGGFSVSSCGRQHIFKPVSVQAMWSALQSLYKVSTKAREGNYFEGGNTHEWVAYYEQHIKSDRSCINEWHTMNDIESRRPPSPDSLRSKPRERLETERIIRSTLKEIMMSVDLDEVTSKYIRTRLEEQLDMDLREFKSFIDQEMLVILGQMDAATEVFPHVYLGSEWNASNLEELNKNKICHILNVTREIDNFFPGTFDYLNIRVYDDDNTDLLKHWDNTYKYINNVKKENSKVLVHCKMGISRSASVVIAYAMKAYNWDFRRAFEYVRKKRTCIKPNQNFINQLETYQGMLDAMKNKEKLQRSKSETNLKSSITKNRFHAYKKKREERNSNNLDEQVDRNEKHNHRAETDYSMLRICSGTELARISMRPKSWSPDNLIVSEMFSSTGTMSQSLEHLNTGKLSADSHSSSASSLSTSPPRIPPAPPLPPLDSRYTLNVRMPCENGLTYSVSQNKIVQLYSAQNQNNCTTEKPPSEVPSSPLPSSVVTKSEYEFSEPEKAQTANNAGPAHNFVLQIPSQFQGNSLVTMSKKHSTNILVKRSVSQSEEEDGGTQQKTRINAAALLSSSSSSSLSSSSLSTTPPSFAIKKEYPESAAMVGGAGDMEHNLNTRVNATPDICYQNEYQNATRWRAPDNEIMYDGTTAAAPTTSPNVINTVQCASVKHRTTLLEKLTHRSGVVAASATTATAVPPSVTVEDESTNARGIVLNLKKEFEAKCNVPDGKARGQRKKCSSLGDSNNNEDSRSLPNSPVNEHSHNRNLLAASSSEDLSVRKLVGKYEIAKGKDRPKGTELRKTQPPIPPRKSSLDINLSQHGKLGMKQSTNNVLTQYNRGHRGVTPIVKSFLSTPNEIRSTVTKAASMLQQGKTHPLSKLNFCKQRNPSPVYNTM